MVDMNALERQLADESLRIVGPEPVVDDAAIFTAVTATQSPKWRFQSMFSATKFVVAGAIVALFGGFLLTGVLSQPSDDGVPGVGASMSPATTKWSEVGLKELEPPEPVGPWRLDLGEQLTFDGITAVSFSHSPDALLVHNAMGGIRRDTSRGWCCEATEAGAYRLFTEWGGDYASVRFEDSGDGLRVLDAGDGTELAFLDGVELDFIELLASPMGWQAIPGFAIMEGNRHDPVDLPAAMTDQAEIAFGVDDTGFVAYTLGRDGLVRVHESRDGRAWTETDTVGDDPGEPTDIEYVGTQRGTVFIGHHDNTVSTQNDDGTWTTRPEGTQPGPLY